MDTICPVCGEPIDRDEIHSIAEQRCRAAGFAPRGNDYRRLGAVDPGRTVRELKARRLIEKVDAASLEDLAEGAVLASFYRPGHTSHIEGEDDANA
jgi:hypothetical protein